MNGGQCELTVEEVKTIDVDVTAGAGIAGGSAELSVGTRTLLHKSSWAKDAAPEGG